MENLPYEAAEYALQQSWETHRQAFGPILEPAFEENQQARMTLTLALNYISRREIKRGLELLKPLREVCSYDEDKAAWAFCVGLGFEMAGKQDKALSWYEEAGTFGHRFYLPYLKIAKAGHKAAAFDVAQKYYTLAIDCLKEMRAEYDASMLASVYTNLISCLTMMHRYQEAEYLWTSEVQGKNEPKGSAATAAILYAALHDHEKVNDYLDILSAQNAPWFEHTQSTTQQILAGEHPHFSPQTVEKPFVQAFWEWFVQEESKIAAADENAIAEMKQRIKQSCPFLQREPELCLRKERGKIKLIFADFYAVGLHCVYRALFEGCPEALRNRWSFSVEH